MPTAQLNPNWRVEHRFTSAIAHNQKAYALLEPILWPDWQHQLEQVQPTLMVHRLFEQTRFTHVTPGPVLICLEQEALHKCQQQMAQCPCGCVLFTEQDLSDQVLLTSLRQRLIVDRDGAETLFRFYDPRSLLPILGAMNNKERRAFFPAVSAIQWYDQDWLLVQITEPTQSADKLGAWSLSDDQVMNMQSIMNQWATE
ncbi:MULTISPECIES: DUF4123 domain-containing protein [unclassified Vibrio]|uniref:DUF4123 domain-containing protein n=1 Tax=unclassified Vibrio TaxID=2614977 RepID=UPI001361549A|nr:MULTISPECIES: DUF4123 domain-containing protein [unclassified Vibrio]NAW56572.1 DUF4123 domain-containing protein [Vibrio sp. V36_P2S2PM302]NAX27675.1 DUF4123 domain-containing protein [Vibrio sp. V38_P2S17PM301]NAX29339.1 DUF4123 domain-containing protein [Vibrio sp. V37_P2S8PM304]